MSDKSIISLYDKFRSLAEQFIQLRKIEHYREEAISNKEIHELNLPMGTLEEVQESRANVKVVKKVEGARKNHHYKDVDKQLFHLNSEELLFAKIHLFELHSKAMIDRKQRLENIPALTVQIPLDRSIHEFDRIIREERDRFIQERADWLSLLYEDDVFSQHIQIDIELDQYKLGEIEKILYGYQEHVIEGASHFAIGNDLRPKCKDSGKTKAGTELLRKARAIADNAIKGVFPDSSC